MKLIIVEDHKIVRDGITAMLKDIDDICINKEFSNGNDFLSYVPYLNDELIIMDIGLPDMSGIEIIKTLKSKNEKIKIIVLSASIDEQTIINCMNEDVAGILSKDVSKEVFIEGIRTVTEGEQYYCEKVSKNIYKSYVHILKGENGKNGTLTNRELEIIKLISDGLSYKEIAKQLFISSRTVETHRKNILEKLCLKTNIDMVKYAIKNKLIEL
jgi:DNA-binding NarL/FixJ family response regulator